MVALSARTGGSRHTGLAALPHENNHSCVIEAMHVHASDKRLTEAGSAKFFVKENGDTTVAHSGILSQRDIRLIQNFIKKNYKEMYLTWRELSEQDFYGKEEG